jgi:hypothetical protein
VCHKERKPLGRIGKPIWGEEFEGIYDVNIANFYAKSNDLAN